MILREDSWDISDLKSQNEFPYPEMFSNAFIIDFILNIE
jgi:hypothetical protein